NTQTVFFGWIFHVQMNGHLFTCKCPITGGNCNFKSGKIGMSAKNSTDKYSQHKKGKGEHQIVFIIGPRHPHHHGYQQKAHKLAGGKYIQIVLGKGFPGRFRLALFQPLLETLLK
ncbi:MAG: hypothetical protein WD601_05335, partial [Pseudohongiellaceae bacterium]